METIRYPRRLSQQNQKETFWSVRGTQTTTNLVSAATVGEASTRAKHTTDDRYQNDQRRGKEGRRYENVGFWCARQGAHMP